MTIDGPLADTREMYLVHDMFRREFGLMPALVRAVTPGDVERAGVVADHITLVTGVLHSHHRGEDDHLWPRLLERVPEEVVPVVHTMEDHHEGIARLDAELETAISAWRADAGAERGKALADVIERVNVLLVEHLGLEEERILPLAEKYVTAAEWAAMVADANSKLPMEMLPLLAGFVTYEGDPEVIEGLFSSLPPEVGVFLRQQAPQAYASHAERVHGTPTPPRATG
ncbi:hemerythrin domain-containing protein [Nonomuraea lactucae]|uniref:hemerythrin domain-containing protein n=1 Tax=Nonomuraea lactucae TaxID=2249762 RepID=UPI0013B3B256|nr:hemerythrin domain-containing protein [Nonomuraea lactucae]